MRLACRICCRIRILAIGSLRISLSVIALSNYRRRGRKIRGIVRAMVMVRARP